MFIPLSLLAMPALLGALHFGPHDVRVFAITKSDNRDQVHFGVHLDKNCVPEGTEPVYGYWRIYEKGPDVVEDLNWMDQKAYGIVSQQITKDFQGGSKVLIALRAAPSRGIAVLTRKQDGRCVAEGITTIDNAPARLDHIFLKIKSWISIYYLEIHGFRVGTGQAVVERVNM